VRHPFVRQPQQLGRRNGAAESHDREAWKPRPNVEFLIGETVIRSRTAATSACT